MCCGDRRFPCSMMGFGAWNGGLEPTFFSLTATNMDTLKIEALAGEVARICPFPCSTWKSRGKGRGPSSGIRGA